MTEALSRTRPQCPGGCYEIEDYLFEHLRRQGSPLLKETLDIGMHYMFWYAAERGDEDRVQHLLSERGADVNSSLPVEGNTPLRAAVAHAPLSMIKLLLNHGADPNVPFSRSRWTPGRGPYKKCDLMAPLQFAVPRDDNYEIVQLLIQHRMGLKIDMRIWGDIIRLTKVDEFRLLVEAGADIDSDPEFLTSLYVRPTNHKCQPIGWTGRQRASLRRTPPKNRADRASIC
ncbi:ankyrin repeat domain-containing protein [Aspergillus undulatus]|uniref:ankyrin repeat domain-containing protein n=1 Tax=Aspergillus undulatus TaxID=1810928 RepID=UPI003CCD6FAD